MNPEMEVVNWWLNRKGFFTINNIKVSMNREIDIIAIKIENGELLSVQHIEIACSISEATNEDYLKKFEEKDVIKVIKNSIKEYTGKDMPYQKVLVIGEGTVNLESIKTLKFSRILTDVINGLDMHNYNSPIIRSFQLMKYLMLSHPVMLGEIIVGNTNKVLNQATRDILIKEILKDGEIKRLIGKKENEAYLIDILKNSTLNRPEKLARLIDKEVLGKKSKKKFINALLETEGLKNELKDTLKKDQKSLDLFLS